MSTYVTNSKNNVSFSFRKIIQPGSYTLCTYFYVVWYKSSYQFVLHIKGQNQATPTPTIPATAGAPGPVHVYAFVLAALLRFFRSPCVFIYLQAMSVVICGTVVPRAALSPEAVQALAASEKPSLAGLSPPPSALVPPPPPRASPQPNPHQQHHQHAMAVDGPVPPPPPRSSRGAQPPPPPPATTTAVVLGGTATPAARKRPTSKAASENPSSPPPPPSPAAATSGPSKGSYPPKAWAPLALPSTETTAAATAAAATASGAADVTVDGVSAADLAPYGEADLSMALTVPPERLQRSAAEANPFDDRFLVPVGAARRVKEAVARLVSLADESGPEGRILEVCMYV